MKEQIIKDIKEGLELFDKIQSKYKLNSESAFRLLCGTVAQESNFKYSIQRVKINNKIVDGEGCSFFQVEAATCIDILHNYIRYPTSKGTMYRKELVEILNKISDLKLNNISKEKVQYELLNNFKFATFIARLVYYRQSFNFNNHDVKEYAYIWKRYYNTIKGAGTELQFIKNYNTYEIDKINY